MPETISGDGFTLNWRGDEVVEEVLKRMEGAVGEFGLRAETKAKQKLRPSEHYMTSGGKKRFIVGGGHGLRTATLQRSIHTAAPGHAWASENVKPSKASPRRGNKHVDAVRSGVRVVLEFGSGLNYALLQHQNHYDPIVHHFLTDAIEETKAKLPAILKKYRLK